MDVNTAQQPIIKKGWLKKQRARVKTWQRRWVVLNGACLFYFNREDDLKSQGSIFLHGNRVVAHSFSPDNTDKYLFEILPEKSKNGAQTHETMLFCCDTEPDRQEWIRAIRRVMYKSLGGAIFGQPLKETMEFEHKNGRKIPYIIEECVEFLENKGLECEGLYRLPGRLVLIKELQESFDTGSRIKFEDTQADVHTVASLLKLYLRELPDSIIPSSHFQLFMGIALDAISSHEHSDESYIPRFTDAVSKLENENYHILQFLCKHLFRVGEQAHINKMTLHNLAMVFGPNIIRHADDNPELFRATAELNQKLALILIKHCDEIFSVSRDPADVPVGNLIDLPLSDCEVIPMQPMYHPHDFSERRENNNKHDPLSIEGNDQQSNINQTNTLPTFRRPKGISRSINCASSSKRKSESELEKFFQKQHESHVNSKEDSTKRHGLLYLNSVMKSNSVQDRKSVSLPPTKKDYEKIENPLNSVTVSSLEDDVKSLRDELVHVKTMAHRERNYLRAELDKYKKMYEDSVKEIECLKQQFDKESSAQTATLQKVMDLQIMLNDYQTKYGQIDS